MNLVTGACLVVLVVALGVKYITWRCEPMGEYELFYFDIRGRGQPIRYLFLDQGIQYKDTSVDPWDKWESQYKKISPFGLCPFLKDGDFLLAESNAILRYLGRKHGLHPDDVKDGARLDMINDNLEDIRKKYTDVIYADNHEAEKEKFLQTLPASLQNLEAQMKSSNTDYIVQEMSFADYNMFDLLDVLQLHSPGCLDTYPTLKAYHARIAARPAIKTYRESEEFKRLKVNYNDYQ